jgi:hypothetical protein
MTVYNIRVAFMWVVFQNTQLCGLLFLCPFGSWLLQHDFPCCYLICNDRLQFRKQLHLQNSPAVLQWRYNTILSSLLPSQAIKFESRFYNLHCQFIHGQSLCQYLKLNHCIVIISINDHRDLGLDRPLSTSSNSFFKRLPSCLRASSPTQTPSSSVRGAICPK